MIPKFVIPLLYVLILVSTDDGQEKKIASENTATILEPEFSTNEKSEISGERVTIQLYYETLCPYCIIFDSQTFVNTVVELQSYLDVYVYPFGNAWVDQSGNIACQHGPAECYGNKLHACAIDIINNMISAVRFNGCMMDGGRRSDDAAADQCGSIWGIDSESIKRCAKGPRGEELLRYYGDETKKVNNFKGVPTVLINGVVGRPDQFRSDVCNSFAVPPTPCRQ